MIVKEYADFWRLEVDIYALSVSGSTNKKGELVMGTGRASQLIHLYPFFVKDVAIDLDKLGFFGWKFIDYSKERFFVRVDIGIGLFQIKKNWYDLPDSRIIYKSSLLLKKYMEENGDKTIALDGISMISINTPRSYIVGEFKNLSDNLLLCF